MYLFIYFFAGKYLPPLNEIFVQEIPIERCFCPDLFLLLTDFQKMLNCVKKIFYLHLKSCKISEKKKKKKKKKNIIRH